MLAKPQAHKDGCETDTLQYGTLRSEKWDSGTRTRAAFVERQREHDGGQMGGGQMEVCVARSS